MKNFKLLICILSLLFYSCTDEIVMEKNEIDVMMSRATASDLQSKTNPNLITDWENQISIVRNCSSKYAPVSVYTPWSTYLTNSSLPVDFCMDIKKKDGWTMLFHTFLDYGLNPGTEYMVFYNIFTGYLKVFYYSSNTLGETNLQWFLKTTKSEPTTAILEKVKLLTGVGKITLNSGDCQELLFLNEISNSVKGLENGWNGFQFHIPRYEELSNDLHLTLGAYSVDTIAVRMEGNYEGEIEGSFTSWSSSDPALFNLAVDMAGNAASKHAGELAKLILGDKHKDSFIVDLVEGLSASDWSDILKAGGKFLFGNSMSTTNIYTVYDVKLKQTGTINIGGTAELKKTSAVFGLGFNLKNILNANVSDTSLKSIVRQPQLKQEVLPGLGVWTLAYVPKVYYNSVQPFKVSYIYQDSYGNVDIEGTSPYPTIEDYDLEVVFNPFIEKYIDSYDVTVDFLESEEAVDDPERNMIFLQPNSYLANGLYWWKDHSMRYVMKAKMRDQFKNEVKYDDNTKYTTVH